MQVEVKIACPNNPRGNRVGYRVTLQSKAAKQAIEDGWAVPGQQNLSGHRCPSCDCYKSREGLQMRTGVDAITPEDDGCSGRITPEAMEAKTKTEAPEAAPKEETPSASDEVAPNDNAEQPAE